MPHFVLFRWLYIVTALFVATNAVVLFQKKLHREVPWFAAYLIFTAISMIALEILWELQVVLHDYVSWFSTPLIIILATMFIIEGWHNLLLDYRTLRRVGRNFLIVAFVVLMIIAAATAPFGGWSVDIKILAFKMLVLWMRCARFVLVGLIVTFFAFTSYLALGWKNFQFGILLGYGLYSAASLACTAYQTKMLGRGIYSKIGVIDSVAYILTLILWLTYLLRGEPKSSALLIPETAKADLEHWNEALTDLVNKK